MDLHLSAKRVAVFGGSRGIGLFVVEAFAAEGAHVAFCARDAAAIEGVVRRLGSTGASVEGQALDASDRTAVAGWIDGLVKAGGIDVAVLCVSALANGASEEDWQRSIQVDLLGSIHMIDALVPALEKSAEKNGDAAIVYISTTAAREAIMTAAYGPVKAALAHFCKSKARELAPRKIRVNTVSPGMVYFEGGAWHKVETGAPERFQWALGRNPTGRMASPCEVADAAVFLASPRSSFTTGANLTVDGALTLGVQF